MPRAVVAAAAALDGSGGAGAGRRLRVAAARADVFFRAEAAGDRPRVVFFLPRLVFAELFFRLPLVFAVAPAFRLVVLFCPAAALRRGAVLDAAVRFRAVLRAADFFAAFFATLTSAVDYGAAAPRYDCAC